MSTVKRAWLRFVVLLFAVVYFVFPYACAYAFVCGMFHGPLWGAILLGVLFQYLIIGREPTVLMNLANSFWLTSIAAPIGLFFSRASLSPAGRLAAAANMADYYRRRDERDVAMRLADSGRGEWHKIRRRVSSMRYFAICCDVKGGILLEKGLYQEALNSYYEPLAENATDGLTRTVAYLNCVAVMNSMGHFAQSLEYLGYVRALNPEPVSATLLHCHAAMALVEMGRTAEARQAVDQALQIADQPAMVTQANVTSAWVWLALADIDQAASALALAEQSIDKQDIIPSFKGVLTARMRTVEGRILEANGRVDEAVAVLVEAAQGGAKSASAMYALVQLYERRGRMDEARAWRDRLVREAPQSVNAKRVQAVSTTVV